MLQTRKLTTFTAEKSTQCNGWQAESYAITVLFTFVLTNTYTLPQSLHFKKTNKFCP